MTNPHKAVQLFTLRAQHLAAVEHRDELAARMAVDPIYRVAHDAACENVAVLAAAIGGTS